MSETTLPIDGATFFTRLTWPPARRPHPALMYAMFLVGAGSSTQPSLRRLESTFLEIAEQQIKSGVRTHDRIIDVIRGMVIVVNFYYIKEEYNLGYSMVCQAARLAIAAGLHRIPSSVWQPKPKVNLIASYTLREGLYAVSPADDIMTHASRILTFWIVYVLDACSAIAYQYDPVFNINDVTTPLPRPYDHYTLGLVSIQDDVPISSILADPPTPGRPDDNYHLIRLKAMTFQLEAARLRRVKPEVFNEAIMSQARGLESRATHMTHPESHGRLRHCLEVFCDHLPPAFRCPWSQWDEEGSETALPRMAMSRQAAIISVLIGDAYLQLWNVKLLDAENTRALFVARRLVSVICLFTGESLTSGFDLFIITIWNEVAMILLREVKRLQTLGDHAGAEVIDADLDVVIDGLKRWASHAISKDHESVDIAAVNTKMLDRLRQIPLDEWRQAFDDEITGGVRQ
ncbi:hypothetical protein M231_07410 [Tremella mesenterica]|uniref:Xylanolytic transcriptional activator regulatory domain-containing protein n=1 Tax=Tremella mesenterica TaxID=5217 RepID=A0A4Q1B993_TREME|nr:hypothetical protein M231_07410 [Tremella mesenterica]